MTQWQSIFPKLWEITLAEQVSETHQRLTEVSCLHLTVTGEKGRLACGICKFFHQVLSFLPSPMAASTKKSRVMRLTVSQQYPGIYAGVELKSRTHCLQGFSEDHRKFRFIPIGAPGALLRGSNTVF